MADSRKFFAGVGMRLSFGTRYAPMPSITLTRQQLYDRAWTTPLDRLAKELGLPGRSLGKLSERHDILSSGRMVGQEEPGADAAASAFGRESRRGSRSIDRNPRTYPETSGPR